RRRSSPPPVPRRQRASHCPCAQHSLVGRALPWLVGPWEAGTVHAERRRARWGSYDGRVADRGLFGRGLERSLLPRRPPPAARRPPPAARFTRTRPPGIRSAGPGFLSGSARERILSSGRRTANRRS